jgi:hypothetical protein
MFFLILLKKIPSIIQERLNFYGAVFRQTKTWNITTIYGSSEETASTN